MASLQHHRLSVRMFQGAMKIAAAVQSLPGRMTPPPFRLLQMGAAYWQSRILYVAARLDLAGALAGGPQTAEALADRLACATDPLHRLLRTLAANGVFRQSAPGLFANNAVSEYLRGDHPKSVRDLVLMHNAPAMAAPWVEALEDAVRYGTVPFEAVHGCSFYDYLDRTPEFDGLFARAMDAVEAVVGDAVVTDVDWRAFKRVIDVGGSKGAKSLSLLAAHPHLRALVFDRPQVVAEAEAHWRGTSKAPLLDRVSFVGGDMLDSIPAAEDAGDAFVFFAVFHGMGDADGAQVLTNLRRAVGSTQASVLIVDAVIDEAAVDPSLAAFDMQMLVNTRGRERTLAEWRGLLTAGGFELAEVVDLRGFAKVLVARLAPLI